MAREVEQSHKELKEARAESKQAKAHQFDNMDSQRGTVRRYEAEQRERKAEKNYVESHQKALDKRKGK